MNFNNMKLLDNTLYLQFKMKTNYFMMIIIFITIPREIMVITEVTQRVPSNYSFKPEQRPTYVLYWNWVSHIERKPYFQFCPKCNTYITSDRDVLGDYLEFDILVFYGTRIRQMVDLPKRRAPHQRYVFANLEPPTYFPICHHVYEDYFNWTLSFKVDSTLYYGYFDLKNAKGEIIGPKPNMHWLSPKQDPVSEVMMQLFRKKHKPVAWFVTHCGPFGGRERWANDLSHALKEYDLTIDIYGGCGTLSCGYKCDEMLDTDYFFYLAFENSECNDYVTEKLVRSFQHNTIPIVYGGANYSRFAPDKSYINARMMTPRAVARKIYELMNDLQAYSEYFWWKPYYSYSLRSHSFCHLCTLINNKTKMKEVSTIHRFIDWWSEGHCHFNSIKITIDSQLLVVLGFIVMSFVVFYSLSGR